MFLPKKRFSFSVKCSLTTRISRMLGLGRKCFVCKKSWLVCDRWRIVPTKIIVFLAWWIHYPDYPLYTRFLTADQSTQSMVFKNIQILSKSFWWIGECCAENSNIFISTSAPWVGTGQLLSQPGSALHIGKRMLMDGRNLRVCLLAALGRGPWRCGPAVRASPS